jgi:hypothetical protein
MRGAFGGRFDLVTSTSAVCHAAFVREGRNHSGAPPVGRHPLLRAFARQVLAANLAPDALVIPLGNAATEAVRLADVNAKRVLYHFPHPSAGNGRPARKYAESRDHVIDQVSRLAA